MSLVEAIKKREERVSVIGLGYVGLPLAVAFDRVADVVGFDISDEKVKKYIDGVDATKEVGDDAVKNANLRFTAQAEDIKGCKFHVIAVPTPITEDKTPNLNPVIEASFFQADYLLPFLSCSISWSNQSLYSL